MSRRQKGVFINSSTILYAVSIEIILSPILTILASLCSLIRCAVFSSEHAAVLIPLTLLHAIDIPAPVPQIAIPSSQSPLTTCFANSLPARG